MHSIIFWCEFPEKVDWKKLKIPFPAEVYVTARSLEEFNNLKNKIPKKIKLGVWPVLSKREGYWFSGFCARKSIVKLLEFKGLDVKIDIEPPILRGKFGLIIIVKSFLKFFLVSGKNNKFLRETIEELAKSSNLIISGLPLPKFLLKRYGDNIKREVGKRNFFIYKTFFRSSLLNLYYKLFIRSRLRLYKEKAMFAIGCVGHGIFGNEPIYKNLKVFEKDLKWFADSGVKNLVVFNLEGILSRPNSKEWLDVLTCFLDNKKPY